MTFRNPAGTTGAGALAYTTSLLNLLGERDPVETLHALLPALRSATDGLTDGQLRTPEAPGRWSVLQIVQHLADTELVYGYRLRNVLAADEPEVAAYDQDAWCDRLRYNDEDLADALDELEVLRRRNLRLLARLRDDEWERVGRHAERGPESVRQMVRLLAAHDLAHLRQIERAKRAIGVG